MKRCIACGRRLPDRKLFALNGAPASAQDIPDAVQVNTDRGETLNLYQCEGCGLVQFDCTPVSYYKEVIRAGGYSTTMKELRRRQYRHLIETYHLEHKKFLEVGCGRGEFLNVLTEFPVDAYGIEQKEDLVRTARESGLKVWQDFAGDAGQVIGSGMGHGPYDVFLSFNFLEHQPDPGAMLQAISHNLTEDGMGLVTVPALEYILEQGSYYELIRDHIAYYSFNTLRALLEQNGFDVLEEEMVNRDTIAMIVKKRPGGTGTPALQPHMISADPLTKGYETVGREIETLTGRLEQEGRSLAIWGASHQGFTLAATTVLGSKARYIIDSAPFKQGRYAPASHLPIVAPEHFYEEPVDAVLIVAPGYTDEIAGIIRQRFGDGVQVMTLRTSHIEILEPRIVITGATGFIGSNVAQAFLEQGAQVYALVRPESRHRQALPVHPNLHVVECGLDRVLDCVEQIGRADAFLHFAWGGVNREEIDSPAMQASNIAGSLDCVRAAHLLGCRVLMDAGSRVEYGITEDGVMAETLPCHPVNEYGRAKLEFYHQAEELCHKWDMTYYHLRFFSVYGTGDHPWSIISTLVRELPQGKTVSLSACRHDWNFMDVEDAARAVLQLYLHSGTRQGESHIVNIASGDTRELRSFVEEIHELCDGSGTLEYGTFAQAKEGALSIRPTVDALSHLTDNQWKEQITFAEGIRKMLKSQR